MEVEYSECISPGDECDTLLHLCIAGVRRNVAGDFHRSNGGGRHVGSAIWWQGASMEARVACGSEARSNNRAACHKFMMVRSRYTISDEVTIWTSYAPCLSSVRREEPDH